MQLGLLGFDSKQWVKIWFLYWHSQAFIPTVHPEQWVKSLITCFKVRIFLVRADHFYYSVKMQKRKNIISINYNQFFCDHGLKTPQKTWIFPRSTRVQFFLASLWTCYSFYVCLGTLSHFFLFVNPQTDSLMLTEGFCVGQTICYTTRLFFMPLK